MGNRFTGTTLVQQETLTEVNKAILDLLAKINQVSAEQVSASETLALSEFGSLLENTATLSNSVSDPNTSIDFVSCYCIDSTKTKVISNQTTFTKSLATFVEGSGGGLISGTAAISTWYACFAIMKEDGTKDYCFDTSETGANIPSPWNYKCFIGWVYNQSTSIILPFYQKGTDFFYKAFVSDLGTATPSASRTFITMTAPPNSEVLFVGSLIASSSAIFVWVRESEFADVVPSSTAHDLYADTAGTNNAAEFEVYVDSSRQLYYRASTTTATIFRILTKGFRIKI